VQPEDATPSYVEIWLPHANAARQPRVRLRVHSPDGGASPWVNEGESWRQEPVPGQVIAEAIYHNAIAPGRDRNMILIALAPTATLQANQLVAPSGVWQIEVQNRGPRATIDAWIQRDDSPFGFPRLGRQSYFDDPAYVRFDDAGREVEMDNASYVQRRRTINSISTGTQTIVVGSADSSAAWRGADPGWSGCDGSERRFDRASRSTRCRIAQWLLRCDVRHERRCSADHSLDCRADGTEPTLRPPGCIPVCAGRRCGRTQNRSQSTTRRTAAATG
jgi:hypothetical protein